MTKSIYVLGNELVDMDKMAMQLIPFLKKEFPAVEFIQFDPTEEFPQSENGEILIIDTVINISRVTKFDDSNYWTISPGVSVHDFDLPLTLGLMKKLGKIKSVKIIGVPPKGNKKEILKDLKELLLSFHNPKVRVSL